MTGLEQTITNWDREAFLAINNGLRCRFFDLVMPRISDLGLGHIQVLAVLLAAAARGMLRGEVRWRHAAGDSWRAVARRSGWVAPMLIAFALSGISASVIKNTTRRDRAAWFYLHEHEAGRAANVRVHTLEDQGRPALKTRGFLSGHTATSVALASCATALFWRRRPLAVAGCWIFAAAISFSRIYIADHWPLDVAAGTVLGILCGLAAVGIYRAWRARHKGQETRAADARTPTAAEPTA